METTKKNIWDNKSTPVEAPEHTYPKGRAKLARTEPSAAYGRCGRNDSRGMFGTRRRNYSALH